MSTIPSLNGGQLQSLVDLSELTNSASFPGFVLPTAEISYPDWAPTPVQKNTISYTDGTSVTSHSTDENQLLQVDVVNINDPTAIGSRPIEVTYVRTSGADVPNDEATWDVFSSGHLVDSGVALPSNLAPEADGGMSDVMGFSGGIEPKEPTIDYFAGFDPQMIESNDTLSVNVTNVVKTGADVIEGTNESYDVFEATFDDGRTIEIKVQDDNATYPFTEDGRDIQSTDDAAAAFAMQFAAVPPNIRNPLSDDSTFKIVKPGELDIGIDVATSETGETEVLIGLDMYYDSFVEGQDYSTNFIDNMMNVTGLVVLESVMEQNPAFRDEWVNAINADGSSASIYAMRDWGTDFSESFVLWFQVKQGHIDGEQAVEISDRLGNRFDILDEINPISHY